jgi:hypothetical protein
MAIAVVLAACGGDATMGFRPHSAVTRDQQPLVNEAIVAYEGDANTLVERGGQLLGSLVAGGSPGQVPPGAGRRAAGVGGTHVLVVDEGSAAWARVRGEGQPPAGGARRAALLVVRVPSPRWHELPPGLRPEPGRHFNGAYPRRGSATEPAPEDISMNWFCTSNRGATQGTCARTAEECGTAFKKLQEADASATPCARASAATCFSAYGPETEPRMYCHPTIQACTAHRDLAFVRGDSIGRECALVQ